MISQFLGAKYDFLGVHPRINRNWSRGVGVYGGDYIAQPVSIALIQLHFPQAGQFSGSACINWRTLAKALLQPQCICTLPSWEGRYEIFRRHTAAGDDLLGNA